MSNLRKYRDPYFTVISETEFLQKLVIEENIRFQFFWFHTVFTGV